MGPDLPCERRLLAHRQSLDTRTGIASWPSSAACAAQLDPFPDNNSRARCYSLNQVVQAARVAGDVTQLDRLRPHLLTFLRPDQDRFYGDQRPETGESGGGFRPADPMPTVIDYLEEMRPRALGGLRGGVQLSQRVGGVELQLRQLPPTTSMRAAAGWAFPAAPA